MQYLIIKCGDGMWLEELFTGETLKAALKSRFDEVTTEGDGVLFGTDIIEMEWTYDDFEDWVLDEENYEFTYIYKSKSLISPQ